MIERTGDGVPHTVMNVSQTKETKPEVPMQQRGENAVGQPVPIREEEFAKFAEQVNAFLQPTRTHVQFEYHDDLKEYYVVVVDDMSKEVVREIPPKKMLDMYAAMTEFIGLLVDKKV